MINTLALSIFPLMMVAAAIGDFLTMRIPNWLTGAMVLSFCILAPLMGMPLDILKWHMAACGVVLVATMGLFFWGKLGGGDAKMLAAGALWVGWQGLIPFLMYTALAGGALALFMIFWQKVRIDVEVRDVSWMKRWFGNHIDLPYGVAIAVGGVCTFPSTWWMSGLV